jgi:hypothetical protein
VFAVRLAIEVDDDGAGHAFAVHCAIGVPGSTWSGMLFESVPQ